MATRSAEHTRALLMLLLANFFWGLSFPVIKAIMLLHAKLLPQAGTWFSTIYTVAPRFVLALAIMLLLKPRQAWRATGAEWKQGVLLGLFAAAGMLFQNDGLQFTAASTSAFLTQLYAILIPVWVALRARHNPGALIWTCCLLVLAGVAILGQFDWQNLRFGRGEAETLLSSVFFMGQILTLERSDFAGNRAEKITFVMFATEAAIFVVLAFATAPNVAALLVPWQSIPWVGHADPHPRLHARRLPVDERLAAQDHRDRSGADLLHRTDLRLRDGVLSARVVLRVGGDRLSQRDRHVDAARGRWVDHAGQPPAPVQTTGEGVTRAARARMDSGVPACG